MRILLVPLPFLLLGVLGVAGIGHGAMKVSRTTRGSGNLRSEVRNVGDFSGLDISGATHAEVTVGPAPSLKIEIDDNLLPLVATEVRGGVLHIHFTGPVSTKHDLRAWITTPHLERTSASGASELTVRGVRTKHMALSFSGASEGKLQGQAEAIELDTSGASQLDLRELPARTAAVEVSGASQLQLAVTDEIRGELSGASQLLYSGSPRLAVETSGASHVHPAN
jgi:putative autotransporter adhesin-like protein